MEDAMPSPLWPQFIRSSAAAVTILVGTASGWAADSDVHDIVIRRGVIYDGSGGKPYVGDVAIDGDRLAYVGPHRLLRRREEMDVHVQAVAPGFIVMNGHYQ